MQAWLWLVPALPLLGFVVLALGARTLSQTAVAVVGAGSVGLSAALAITLSATFIATDASPQVQTLWTWMAIAGFTPEVALRLDALSLVMMLVVTCVGFLIHLYSTEYMAEDRGYARFFAYMNLFVAAMLVLVLADNLLLLYLGWEGVGICSYLLIGFWYQDPDNCLAARKAFTVTRIGDAAMAVGLFLLFTQLGTLNIQDMMSAARAQWAVGSPLAIAAAALLLCGAVGKSAQVPLQTWLPDAMAGPTPVSALLHAATMVTAGVYLIARTHTLFQLAPAVQHAVAIIGAATLLLAGFAALAQRDLKRVLAYSTISQIGYMFLALGVGAWSAAIFHFMTHAFFKALLFLAAGVVIHALDDEHDIYRMGGLRKRLPSAFWAYLIGSASLAALPLITAGFYSKDMILARTWASPLGGPWLWAAGLAGALLTGLYIFRSVFVAFFGEARTRVGPHPAGRILVTLAVLSIGALIAGFLQTPHTLGGITLFSEWLHQALPESPAPELDVHTELLLQLLAAAASLGGIYLAWRLFHRAAPAPALLTAEADGGLLARLWSSGWGFDRLYARLLVQPYTWLAAVNRHDVVDTLYNGVARISRVSHGVLSETQTGRVRWYAGVMAGGAVFIVAIAVLS